MEKSCLGQEGHPPSRVNFSERLYRNKVDPSAQVKSWLCIDNRARACSDRLSLTEWTRLGEPKCLQGEKLARLGSCPSPFQPSQLFVSHVNGSSSFVRKRRKSWLAWGSSGRRVTLLPGTTFLHIKGTQCKLALCAQLVVETTISVTFGSCSKVRATRAARLLSLFHLSNYKLICVVVAAVPAFDAKAPLWQPTKRG